MNVFITGATGFIGANLCRYLLQKGHKIYIGVRNNSNLINIENIKNDITLYYNTNSVNDLAFFLSNHEIEVVFHLASCFIAEHKSEDIERLISSNLLYGTLLLEAMKIAGIKKFVNTGTSWQHYQDEHYNPVCLYAATKEAFEKLIKYYTEAEGVTCITLKLFDSYGENDLRPKLINVLNKYSLERKTIDMSHGEQEINLLHVEDICSGYEKAYELLSSNNNPKMNKQFALVAKETITLRELIMLFNRISNKEILVNWGSKPYRKREVMKLWSTFKTLPNWEQKISLEEGLIRIFKK